jgi:hypothetical protein
MLPNNRRNFPEINPETLFAPGLKDKARITLPGGFLRPGTRKDFTVHLEAAIRFQNHILRRKPCLDLKA